MEGARTGTARMDRVVRVRMHQAIALPGLMSLVVNAKEHGLIHRLSDTSRGAARDRRRTVCGWRAGSAASNAHFCNTSLWPPLGAATTRLCSKCFPSADAAAARGAPSDDPIEDD